jgi:OOP family OmpA-OmpF porin
VRAYAPPAPPIAEAAPAAPPPAPAAPSAPAAPPAPPAPASPSAAAKPAPPAQAPGGIVFEDVQFDLDQSTLRPDAIAVLQRAVAVLRQNPGLRVHIEGHASEEATAEYNLALGARRADAVRDYLVSNGIDASRLQTVSYGEARPKYDNSREETRRLNRRAAFVIDP